MSGRDRADNPDKVAYLYNKDVVDIIESNWDDQRILDVSRALQDWEPFSRVHYLVRGVEDQNRLEVIN